MKSKTSHLEGEQKDIYQLIFHVKHKKYVDEAIILINHLSCKSEVQ